MALSKQRFLILTSLAGEPRHGYGLILDIEKTTNGSVKIKPGTLYHALEKMVEEELVIVDREEIVSGRLRKIFSLTRKGRECLGAQAREQVDLGQQALVKLGLA